MLIRQAVETIMHRSPDSTYVIDRINKIGQTYVISGTRSNLYCRSTNTITIHVNSVLVKLFEQRDDVCRSYVWPTEYYEKKKDGLIFAIRAGVEVRYYYGYRPGQPPRIDVNFVYHIKSRDKRIICFTDGIVNNGAMPPTPQTPEERQEERVRDLHRRFNP